MGCSPSAQRPSPGVSDPSDAAGPTAKQQQQQRLRRSRSQNQSSAASIQLNSEEVYTDSNSAIINVVPTAEVQSSRSMSKDKKPVELVSECLKPTCAQLFDVSCNTIDGTVLVPVKTQTCRLEHGTVSPGSGGTIASRTPNEQLDFLDADDGRDDEFDICSTETRELLEELRLLRSGTKSLYLATTTTELLSMVATNNNSTGPDESIDGFYVQVAYMLTAAPTYSTDDVSSKIRDWIDDVMQDVNRFVARYTLEKTLSDTRI